MERTVLEKRYTIEFVCSYMNEHTFKWFDRDGTYDRFSITHCEPSDYQISISKELKTVGYISFFDPMPKAVYTWIQGHYPEIKDFSCYHKYKLPA